MSEYEAGFARYYDLFYSDKPYEKEVAVVDLMLRTNAAGPSERLLDVACGTGRHAVGFADRGWSVVGIDRSPEMLRRAEERVDGLPLEFRVGDMRSLDLPVASFDAATCLFDSIGYALSNDGIVSTLSGIRRSLRPGGLLAMEFWHAPPMLSRYEPIRVREWTTIDSMILRVSTTSLDVVAQAATVSYSVHRLGIDGRYESWDEVHRNRYFQVQEMALLLHTAGLSPEGWFAAYDAEATIDASTWHILALARRPTEDG